MAKLNSGAFGVGLQGVSIGRLDKQGNVISSEPLKVNPAVQIAPDESAPDLVVTLPLSFSITFVSRAPQPPRLWFYQRFCNRGVKHG